VLPALQAISCQHGMLAAVLQDAGAMLVYLNLLKLQRRCRAHEITACRCDVSGDLWCLSGRGCAGIKTGG
jgi:hypothetical protein